MKNKTLRGIIDVFPSTNLDDFLVCPRRVKLGFDPTSDFLHLGHSILLRKLRAFQDDGHTPVIIIGDFTARIGDPSGKSSTRKQLSEKEVRANVGNFISVIEMFLDPSLCDIRFNSHHLENMSMSDAIRLQSMVTVQQLLAKQDFSKRFDQQIPISLHEFMYPLFQGYDSFIVESDIELGGVDQKFNVSIGRDVQKHFNCKVNQIGMLMPILVGTDGTQKMSKSLGNTIGINEHPIQMFSKLEKIPDHCVDDYITLLTDCEIGDFPNEPREKQKQMAFEVVSTFHGRDSALKAKQNAEAIVISREVSDVDVPKLSLNEVEFPIGLPNLLKNLGIADSTSDARRKIKAGSVRIDGVKVTDENHTISDKGMIVGKLLQTSRKDFFSFT